MCFHFFAITFKLGKQLQEVKILHQQFNKLPYKDWPSTDVTHRGVEQSDALVI